MTLPIDEMLTELRAVLEDFEKEPSYKNFYCLQLETTRIERTCEELIP